MKRLVFNHHADFCAVTGADCHPRAQLVVRSLALIVATIATIGFARAADELPSQDQAIARALENHPDIVAAKAKVALAEAELYGKRMEVSRQILGLYGGLKTLDAQIDAAKASLKQSRTDFERIKPLPISGEVDQATKDKMATAIQLAEGKLVQATAQREQAERELRLLIGAAPRAKEEKLGIATAIRARQAPQGRIVDDWRAVADAPIKISVAAQPLEAVLNFLSDKTGIKFSLQQPVLADEGMDVELPISLSTHEVPLRAALQGFEDNYPALQFVLRDYGVLLTTKEYAERHGYMPALEIGNDPSGRR